jgi:6-phosphogluconolactonase (cycloisomerase 2 family)
MRLDSVPLVSAPFSNITQVQRNFHEAVAVQAELLRSVSPRASSQALNGFSAAAREPPVSSVLVYFGTYTRVLHHSRGTGKGVYGYRLNRERGLLEPIGEDTEATADAGLVVRARGLLCPAYFCRDRGSSGHFLWAVNETSKFDYARQDVFGSVTLFRWHPREGGLLEHLGETPTAGHGACHPWTDRRGRFLLVANYWSGSVVVYYIEREKTDDGSAVTPRLRMVQHVQFVAPVDADDKDTRPCASALLGLPDAMQMAQKAKTSVLGFRRDRQDGPHSHQIVIDPMERYLYVPDLGSDRIYQFLLRFDEAEAELHGIGTSGYSGDAHTAELDSMSKRLDNGSVSTAREPMQLRDDANKDHGRRFVTPAGVVSNYPFQAVEGGILYETADARATGVVSCLVPHPAAAYVPVPPSGAGPRHMLLHPSGRWALVLCELNATLLCYAWDGTAPSATATEYPSMGGMLATGPTTVLDLLPRSYRQRYSPQVLHQHNISSALRLHPLRTDRLYASNRGHDSIAVIEFSALDGSMKILQWVASGGRTPRDIAIDPYGERLFVANQDSDQVCVFALDLESGVVQDCGAGNPAKKPSDLTDHIMPLRAMEKSHEDPVAEAPIESPFETIVEPHLRPCQLLSICEPCTVFVEEAPSPA